VQRHRSADHAVRASFRLLIARPASPVTSRGNYLLHGASVQRRRYCHVCDCVGNFLTHPSMGIMDEAEFARTPQPPVRWQFIYLLIRLINLEELTAPHRLSAMHHENGGKS